MEIGYIKANSTNLPMVDSLMIGNFFATNKDFCSGEIRNMKTSSSSEDSYGDSAIGYVQLKRDSTLCTVKCKIHPEHKCPQKSYRVSLVVDEKENIVQSIHCEECSLAQGGCKHAVALLFWVHRRSEEPSCTSTKYYWKKPKVAQIESSSNFITVAQMTGKQSTIESINKENEDNSVFTEFIKEAKRRNIKNSLILKYQPDYEVDKTEQLSMHQLSLKYNTTNDCDTFLNNISHVFTPTILKEVEKETCDQHKNNLWHELRFARITASKAYDISNCETADEYLISVIMDAKIPDTPAIKRRRKLKSALCNELEMKIGKIVPCGLYISKDYPMLAASPDGILDDDTIVEIKCPNEKTFEKYIQDGNITPEFIAQLQLQMFVTNFKKAIFCVASHDFQNDSEAHLVVLEYDEEFVNNLVSKLTTFWKNHIYPLLLKYDHQ